MCPIYKGKVHGDVFKSLHLFCFSISIRQFSRVSKFLKFFRFYSSGSGATMRYEKKDRYLHETMADAIPCCSKSKLPVLVERRIRSGISTLKTFQTRQPDVTIRRSNFRPHANAIANFTRRCGKTKKGAKSGRIGAFPRHRISIRVSCE